MATQALEKFEVRNRWSGNVQFVAEISCAPDQSPRIKLGLAVKWGRDNDADLSDADLSDADLSDADLRGADLRGADLRGADLRGADLSDADLRGAVLRDADLRGADLRGADLSDADLRDADLRGAVLRGAVLRDAVLRGAVLRDADLRGADLRGADLSDADLSDAVLRDADLSGAVLRDADLSDCPAKIENIHQQIFEAASVLGALEMGSWHCGTAHCRAGWAVTLAGEAGKALEWAMGTPAAATMIYLASDPTMERFPNFYASNADALEDMRIMAEREAARLEASA